MPTYSYYCSVCSNEFDSFQSISEKPITECPKCLVSCLTRIITTAPKFVLKGDGWSADNYQKKA